MKKKKEIWLNLGSGVSLADDFINVDNFFTLEDLKNGIKTKSGPFMYARVPKGAKFVKADMCALPFEDNYADYVECSDAIEHIGMRMVPTALKEMYRVLKPGGKLGLETTNFDELARLWTDNITGKPLLTDQDYKQYLTLSQVIYGHQMSDGEYHRTPFNPVSLVYHLVNAGFKLENIVLTIYPTSSKFDFPQKSFKHMAGAFKDSVYLTEMMWAEATK